MKTSAFHNISVDSVKEYWNRRPCNIRHSDKRVGTLPYFEEVARRKYFVEPHILTFADFDHWRGKRILEIGCGIGTATTSFAQAGAQVTAIDISESSVKIAQERIKLYKLNDSVQFIVGDAEHLSDFVKIEPYDCIFSFGVIHHTPHPQAVLQQALRYCHKNTELRIMVYHRNSYKVASILLSQPRSLLDGVAKTVALHSEAQTGCPITYIYSRRQGRDLMNDAGFRVIKEEVDHIFPYRIPEYVQYKYVRQWHFAMLPKQIFRLMERRFGWHLCLTGIPQQASLFESTEKL